MNITLDDIDYFLEKSICETNHKILINRILVEMNIECRNLSMDIIQTSGIYSSYEYHTDNYYYNHI